MSYNIFFATYFFLIMVMYLLLLGSKATIKQTKLLLIAIIMISSLLIYFKPLEVKDTIGYLNIYEADVTISNLVRNVGISYGNRYLGFDIGFLVYMYFIRSIGVTFRGFTFINSIISITLFVYGIHNIVKETQEDRRVEYHKVVMLVMIMFGLHYSAIALRGGLSIGLGVCAVGESLKKNRKGLLIFILIALSMLVQSMGILNIIPVLIILLRRGISRNISICIHLLIAIWLLLNIGKYVVPFASQFLLKVISGNGIKGYSTKLIDIDCRVGVRDWIMWVVSFDIVCFSRDSNIYQKILKTIALCGIIILCLGYPFRAISRAVDYFYIYLIPIMYENIEINSIKSLNRVVTMLSILGLLAIQVVTVY